MKKTFREEVIDKVQPVFRAWQTYSIDRALVDHPTSRAAWLRLGFCECKPYSGTFNGTVLEMEMSIF